MNQFDIDSEMILNIYYLDSKSKKFSSEQIVKIKKLLQLS